MSTQDKINLIMRLKVLIIGSATIASFYLASTFSAATVTLKTQEYDKVVMTIKSPKELNLYAEYTDFIHIEYGDIKNTVRSVDSSSFSYFDVIDSFDYIPP